MFNFSMLEEMEDVDVFEPMREKGVNDYKYANHSTRTSGLIKILPENADESCDRLKFLLQKNWN